MEKKRKAPLPGYRLIFAVVGTLLLIWGITVVCASLGRDVEAPVETRLLVLGIGVMKVLVGGVYLWWSYHLTTARLDRRDWKIGWLMFPLGILTFHLWFFAFGALIWNDGDTKACFPIREEGDGDEDPT